MPATIASQSTASPTKGLAARVVGVLTSPRATYTDIAAHPRWLGTLALVSCIAAGGVFTLLSTEVGRRASLDQQIRVLESFGMKINDTMYQQMQARLERAPLFGALGQLFFVPVAALAVAGIALGVFNPILGGDARFQQVFAIVVHSGLVISLQQLFSFPLDYARETLSSPTTLAAFAPFLDESGFLSQMLGSIDLFIIWWITSLAIGLGVLYKRPTGSIAASMLVIYVGLAVVIAAIKSALTGA